MKRVNKSTIPQCLKEHIDKAQPSPEAWRLLDLGMRTKVKEQIQDDQRGLCAYCEIRIREPKLGSDDFQVEHFYPQSSYNEYQLIWNNLLGVCCGGSQPTVKGHFIKIKDIHNKKDRLKERHCGIPKGNQDPSKIRILNPLEIPTFPCLFKIKRGNKNPGFEEGKNVMEEDVKNGNFPCNEIRFFVDMDDEELRSLVPYEILERAQNSINELNLNCRFLSRARYNAIWSLRKKLVSMSKMYGEAEASKELMSEVYAPDGDWPQFFTTIRAEFGEYAEERLKEIGYDG